MKLHLPKSLRSAMLAVIVSACSFTLSSASLCAAESPAAEPAASGEPAASAAPVQVNGSAFVATILDVLDAVIGGSSSVGSASVGMGGTSFTMAAPVQDNGTEAPAPVSSPAPDNLAPLTVPVVTSSPAPVDYTVKCDYQGENLSAAPAASVSSLDLAPKAAPYVSGGASSSGSSSSPASAPAAGGGAAGGASGSAGRPAPLMLAAASPAPVVKKAEATGRKIAWLGGERDWNPEGEDLSWRLQSNQQEVRFKDGDDVQFVFSDTEATKANITGSYSVNDMVIDGGSGGKENVVTFNTIGSDSGLDVTRVNGYSYTRIKKEGEGYLTLGVTDSGFGTHLEALEGTMSVRFSMPKGSPSFLVSDITADKNAFLNLLVGDDDFAAGVAFQNTVRISNASSITLSAGSTMQLNSLMYTNVTQSQPLNNSGFYMDRDIAIHLGGARGDEMSEFVAFDASIKADHWTVEGKGFASFNGIVRWENNSADQKHYIKGESEVSMRTVTYSSPESVVCIDGGSSLKFHDLYMNNSQYGENHLYHAFEETGMDGYRQCIYVENNLYIGKDKPAHIGSAANEAGYQEAGDFDIKNIQGEGVLVLENNVVASSDDQCLTEAFYIGRPAGTPYSESNFKGVIRLESNGDGLDAGHKKQNVLVIRDYTVTWDAVLEVKNDGRDSDYGIGIDSSRAVEVYGIRDADGSTFDETNSVKIFSGPLTWGKNAEIKSDDVVRTLVLYTELPYYDYQSPEYRSSAGVDKNLNLHKYKEGTQTFTGDFQNFNSDIHVGRTYDGKAEAGGILNILNNTKVTVEDLVIYHDSRLNVNKGDDVSEDGTVYVQGTFSAKGTWTNHESGHASELDANLVMTSGSVLDVHNAVGMGGVDMKHNVLDGVASQLGGALTFEQGTLLSQDDWNLVWSMDIGEKYDLAFHVGSLNSSSDISGFGEDGQEIGSPIDASTIFGNNQFYQGEYFLCYSGSEAGGRGNNVGTVYLYKAAPEPTTGTLSLLALAGLAARRRRK